MNSLRALSCCGGIELIGLNGATFSPREFLSYYLQQYEVHLSNKPENKGMAFITFSYAWDTLTKDGSHRTYEQGRRRLAALVKFVKDNELGDIMLMPKSSYNPNYKKRHRIRAGIFVPDNKAMAELYLANKWLKKPIMGVWSY